MPNDLTEGAVFFLTMAFAPSADAADRRYNLARRYTGNTNGERYLANTSQSKREIHDLDNEKTGANQCPFARVTTVRTTRWIRHGGTGSTTVPGASDIHFARR